jgi:DNA-binding response OmpR family regulator
LNNAGSDYPTIGGNRMKILLIEDDEATVETIRMCMEIYHSDTKIISTNQGLKALDMLKTEKFDVALIDLGLPDIDGIDLLRKIRDFSNIPALIISARHSVEAIESAKKLGAIDYITKPFDFHKLLNTLTVSQS